MRKKSRLLLLLILLILVGLQFTPTETPENLPVEGKDILVTADVPEDIKILLKNACYDCHSQHVRYPWYSYIAPVSWLVNRDVNMGRSHLDFSFWGDYSRREQLGLLDEIYTEIESGSMPMPIYSIMHKDARLAPEDIARLLEWTEHIGEEIFNE